MNTLAEAPASILDLINDWSVFNDLKDQGKAKLVRKLSAIEPLLRGPQHGQKGQIAQAAARLLGVNTSTIHRLVNAYTCYGVKGLLDGRKEREDLGLPQLFRSFVAGQFDQHQRVKDDAKEVQRSVIDRWNLWRASGDPQYAIPGYDFPPLPTPATGIPHGWSIDNIRRLKPRGYASVLTKQGRKAADKHLPSILNTRVGSAYLSRILFDDQDYDTLLSDHTLALSGITDAMRPVGFNCIDFFTACHLSQHVRAEFKQRLEDDRKITKTLTKTEATWFFIDVLQQHGYRTDALGTEIVCEHGTADAWRNRSLSTVNGYSTFDDAIHALTGGKVRVSRSGLFNAPMFADMYFRGSGGGNPNFKTWIESSFRLVRTYMQALPGPIGRNADFEPEEHLAIKNREAKLLKAIHGGLAPYHAQLIRRSLLNLTEFAQLISAIYRAINARTEHDLEGWQQLGFVTSEWRTTPESELWHPAAKLESLHPIDREQIIASINSNPRLYAREAKLSPEQARQICMADPCIKKLPDSAIPLLIPREWSIERKVGSDHTIQLPNPLWPDAKEQYVCQFMEGDRRVTLNSGTRLRCYANPLNADKVVLTTPEGEFIGTLHRTVRAEVWNTEAKVAQFEMRAGLRTDLDMQARERMADIATQRTEDQRFNDRILTGKPVTPEEIAEARSAAGQKGQRTAAANRLQKRGKATDWNAEEVTATEAAFDPFPGLPDDEPLPPSL